MNTRIRKKRGTCSDCQTPIDYRAKRCQPCYGLTQRGGRHISQQGYAYLSGYYGHPNANSLGKIFEHVKVMGDILGRPLLRGENVHHKNGVRDDNRPENLELWVINQPPGQRVSDLVTWAKVILERYDA